MAQVIGGFGSHRSPGIVPDESLGKTMSALTNLAGAVVGQKVKETMEQAAFEGAQDYANQVNQFGRDGALARIKEQDKDANWGMPTSATRGAQVAEADAKFSEDLFKLQSSDEWKKMTPEAAQAALYNLAQHSDANVQGMLRSKVMQVMPKVSGDQIQQHFKYTQDKLVEAEVSRVYGLTTLGEHEQAAYALTREGATVGLVDSSWHRVRAGVAAQLAGFGDMRLAQTFTQDLMLDPTIPEEVKQEAARNVQRNIDIRTQRFVDSDAGKQGAAERITFASTLSAGVSKFKSVEDLQAYMEERRKFEESQPGTSGISPNYNPKQQERYIEAYMAGETRKATHRATQDKQQLKNAAMESVINMVSSGVHLVDAFDSVSRWAGNDNLPSKEDVSRGLGNAIHNNLIAAANGDAKALDSAMSAILQDAGRSKEQQLSPAKPVNLFRDLGANAIKGKESPQLRVFLDNLYAKTQGNETARGAAFTYLFGAEAGLQLREQYETLGAAFGGVFDQKTQKTDLSATDQYLQGVQQYRSEVTPEVVMAAKKEFADAIWPNAIKDFFFGGRLPTQAEKEQFLATINPELTRLIRRGYRDPKAIVEVLLPELESRGYQASGFGIITPTVDATRADGSKAFNSVNDELAVTHGLRNGLKDKTGKAALEVAVYEEAFQRFPDYDVSEIKWENPLYRGDNIVFAGRQDGKAFRITVPLETIAANAESVKTLEARMLAVDREKSRRENERLREKGVIPQDRINRRTGFKHGATFTPTKE